MEREPAAKHAAPPANPAAHGGWFRRWFDPSPLPAALEWQELRVMLREAQRAREAAELAVRVQDESIATLAHRLRTPLQTVLGWARLMRQGGLSPAEALKAAEIIERNASRQAVILHELVDAGNAESAPLDAMVPAAPSTNGFGVSLDGASVLVVDDEPDACEMTRRVLTHCGAEVMTAVSAAEALELFDGHVFDIVVSDIQMAEMDGHELMRRIRTRDAEHRGGVPAVALTSFAREADRTRAHLAGYQVHLAKPADPEELVAVIGASLGRTGRGTFANGESRMDETQGVRILLLDDEGDLLELLRRNFDRAGYATRTATSLAEAVGIAAQFKPSFLVVDWLLGRGENGASAARAVRAVCPGVRVIVVSGLGPEQVRSRLGDLPVLAVVEKPFPMEALYAPIREASANLPGS